MIARDAWADGLARLMEDMAASQLAATQANEAAIDRMVMALNRIERSLAQVIHGSGSLEVEPPANPHRRSENG